MNTRTVSRWTAKVVATDVHSNPLGMTEQTP